MQFDSRCGDEVCDLCGVSSLETRMKIKKKIRDEVDYSMRVFKAVLLERMEKLLAPKVA
jgi:hypothetical protein